MMNLFRLAGELILLYILYKLIVDFIIPIYKTTTKVKKQFGEMQNKMQSEMNKFNAQQSAAKAAAETKTKTPPGKEEYIDYEEIKE